MRSERNANSGYCGLSASGLIENARYDTSLVQMRSERNANSGYAGLTNGLIADSQIPQTLMRNNTNLNINLGVGNERASMFPTTTISTANTTTTMQRADWNYQATRAAFGIIQANQNQDIVRDTAFPGSSTVRRERKTNIPYHLLHNLTNDRNNLDNLNILFEIHRNNTFSDLISDLTTPPSFTQTIWANLSWDSTNIS